MINEENFPKTVLNICFLELSEEFLGSANHFQTANGMNPASILRKSISGRHRPVSYPDGPMTARYRFS